MLTGFDFAFMEVGWLGRVRTKMLSSSITYTLKYIICVKNILVYKFYHYTFLSTFGVTYKKLPK